MSNEFFKITTPNGSDFELFKGVVNKGIDSHLEGFTKSEFFQEGHRFVFNFHRTELPILLRRLREVGDEEADMWASDIEDALEQEKRETTSKTAAVEPRNPLIKITFSETTPESVEQGDFSDTGFLDEKGVSMLPDEWDANDYLETLPESEVISIIGDIKHLPYAEQIKVENKKLMEMMKVNPSFLAKVVAYKTAKYLEKEGASYTSSSHFDSHAWYETDYQTTDYKTGTERQEAYHLYNFTEEEMRLIWDKMHPKKLSHLAPDTTKRLQSPKNPNFYIEFYYRWPNAVTFYNEATKEYISYDESWEDLLSPEDAEFVTKNENEIVAFWDECHDDFYGVEDNDGQPSMHDEYQDLPWGGDESPMEYDSDSYGDDF